MTVSPVCLFLILGYLFHVVSDACERHQDPSEMVVIHDIHSFRAVQCLILLSLGLASRRRESKACRSCKIDFKPFCTSVANHFLPK